MQTHNLFCFRILYWFVFFIQEVARSVLNKNRHLLDNLVATKAGDKFSRRSHSEVPLEINTPAISALLHKVQARHAWSVSRNTKNAFNSPGRNRVLGSYADKEQITPKLSFSTVQNARQELRN